MEIILSNSSGQPFYQQIVDQVKKLIQAGRLQEGEALPSMRLLAKELRISVITTKRAYEELEQAGYLVTVAGKGSFAARPAQEEIRREQDARVEEHLRAAASAAKAVPIPLEELQKRVAAYYEEEN